MYYYDLNLVSVFFNMLLFWWIVHNYVLCVKLNLADLNQLKKTLLQIISTLSYRVFKAISKIL